MKCPYCSNEMKTGVIQSPNEISWQPKKAKLFAAAELNEEAVVLAKRSFIKGSTVVAYCCTKCKKILIDYNNNDLIE